MDNIIDIKEKQTEKIINENKGIIHDYAIRIRSYVTAKVNLLQFVFTLSKENLDFVQSLKDNNILIDLIINDCLSNEYIRNYMGNLKNIEDKNMINKIDEYINQFLINTFSNIKDIYKDRV